MSADLARHYLRHRAVVFGFRDGERRRPFYYDFTLPGMDGAEASYLYEIGREIGTLTRVRGINPGFYPEGEPSGALVDLVLNEYDFVVPEDNAAALVARGAA